MKKNAARWYLPALGMILIISGMEIFFQFASQDAMKKVALALMLTGVFSLGWPASGRVQLWGKFLVCLPLIFYLYDACGRFLGLTKEDLDPLAYLGYSFRITFFTYLASFMVTAAVFTARKIQKRREVV